MSRLRAFGARARGLFVGRRAERELAEELEAHLQLAADEYVRRGLAPDKALRAARLAFGGVEQTKEAYREQRGLPAVDGLAQDVRYALRSLWRSPLFTVATLLTLTVGVGVPTAMFHVIDRVVVRPIPYPDPDRIVYLGWRWTKGMSSSALSATKFTFWHDNSRVFDGLSTSRWFGATVDAAGSGNTAEDVDGLRVTRDFFRVTGIRPSLGRGFSPDEYATPAAPVAILSHAMWVLRLGGDPHVIGRAVRVNNQPLTVVGVMPPVFDHAGLAERADVLTPLAFSPADLTNGGNMYTVVGRLRPDITANDARRDMQRVFEAYRRALAESVQPDDRGVVVSSYREAQLGHFVEELWILLGATFFVFLLACANASNLLFVRALGQRRQFAVCLALGAGRARVARRVVVEAVLLGGAAAALAVLTSLASLHGLHAIAGGYFLVDERQLGVDARVVACMSMLAVAAMMIVGAIVALSTTNIDLATGLSEASRRGSTTAGQQRARSVLVGVEVAMASTLLLGALLLMVSFAHVLGVDPGFARNGVVTAEVTHAPPGYDDPRALAQLETRVLDALRGNPEARDPAATLTLPLRGSWNLPAAPAERPDDGEGAAQWRAVSSRFFDAFGIPIVRGRAFAESDVRGAPPVAIISQSMASAYWPGEDPIGRQIIIGRWKGKLIGPQFDDPPRVVVGVVPDLRDLTLDATVQHTAWIPVAQAPVGMAAMLLPKFVVRTRDLRGGGAALRTAILQADPRMSNVRITPMSKLVADSVAGRRLNMILMGLFAAVALILTCLGIYGVVAYTVARRTAEIGIRLALGASPRGVMSMVVGQGMRPVAFGLIAGLIAALAVSRYLSLMLYGVGPRDPAMFAAAAAMIVLVAAVANYIPARRAARTSPVSALRAE